MVEYFCRCPLNEAISAPTAELRIETVFVARQRTTVQVLQEYLSHLPLDFVLSNININYSDGYWAISFQERTG